MTLYLMLFALSPSSSSHTLKRRKLERPHVTREIILAKSGQESERLILVPKPPPTPPRNDESAAMEVDEDNARATNGPDSSLTDHFIRYDLYRETRMSSSDPNMDISVDPANPSDAIKSKGVHFTADAVKKDEAQDPERLWKRELLHSDLGPLDILFIPDFVLVGEARYPVDTWRWKSDPADGKNVKPSTPLRLKKRGLKKRKIKGRKNKAESTGLIGEAAPLPLASEVTSVPKGDTEGVLELQPDVEPKEPGESIAAQEVPQPMKTAPVAVEEDREEGELSDETPAA